MHGRLLEGEDWKQRRHMWPVPALGTTTVAGSPDSIHSVTSDSFFKDGRKIRVGDCALFKPLQDTSPPFIGIIRWLTLDKENYLKLGVNWLYRPADVKLNKGITLEAAPNEIFYSFHKDEIPAASLLHPCKVAFLRKGVELPLGISSFVCRRVYDTSNKRLYWLTDQDYINERQEEVDQLLDKTRLEMHAVQSGGRSPKPLNGPTSASQLKPTSDGAQNSTNTFPSQAKGRKRDRSDQGSESIKRERSMKTEDGHSGQFRSESTLKSEIAKITDKGGLVDFEGVEKFVQLIGAEKKIDLAGRTMLADVITVTDKYDCLGKFVHLRGLSVLDEWLQEVHKGKIGDGISSKESDKSVEDFLFALLRALDKLPVDLHALQTDNVGKSVNNLRGHKNLEIQKKVRGLVDKWKKRVEAEMNMNDAKSGPNQSVSWPNKPGFSDVAHGGSRRAGGSSEAPVKNSVIQTTIPKVTAAKPGHGDSSSKLPSLSPGSAKSPSLSTPIAIPRDSPSKMTFSNSASDVPMSTIKEERSSSSSQSQNNSQSCSSEHAKPAGSLWKEDARSSTAGSLNMGKTSSSAARLRKSSNGSAGSAVSGVSKESTLVKCGSMEKKTTSEKVPQAGLACERAVEGPSLDNGSNHRLIVRLPNLGRSPARSANGSTHDDPSSIVNRASSPRFPEKQDPFERKVKGKSDSCRSSVAGAVNKESRHRNDLKDGLAGSDDGDESPASFLDEELDRNGDELGKSLDSSKATCSSSGIHKGNYPSDSKPGKLHDASFRSINVLIESCVKYSEAIPSMPAGDDRGMNLLASVAAGEMSKSEQVSPIGSPGKNLSVQDDSNSGNEARRLCSDDITAQSQRPEGSADGDLVKQVPVLSPLQVKGEEVHVATDVSSSRFSEDCKTISLAEEKPAGEDNAQTHVSVVAMEQDAHPCLGSDGRINEATTSTVGMLCVEKKECPDGGGVDSRIDVPCRNSDDVDDLKPEEESPSDRNINCADEKIAQSSIAATASDLARSSLDNACNAENLATGVKDEKELVGESVSCAPLETNDKGYVREGSGDRMLLENKLLSTLNLKAEGIARGAELSSAFESVKDHGSVDEKTNCVEERTELKQNELQRKSSASTLPGDPDSNTKVDAGCNLSDYNTVVHNSSERKDGSGGSSTNEDSHENSTDKVGCLKPSGTEADKSEECISTTGAAPSSVTARSDMGGKLDFDLNEGFPVDDGCQGETVTSVVPGYTSVANLHGPLSFLPSMSNGHPLVPVAAAARDNFVPPETFLKSTGEKWRGSAATSAFRPAEPRKVLEMPLSTSDVHREPVLNKQGRPALDIDLNEPDDKFHDDISLQCAAPLTTSLSGVPYIRDYRRSEGSGTSTAPIRSVGGLDLDLNRADEDTEVGQVSTSSCRRFDVLSVKQPLSEGFSNPEVNVLRNFDLNNGPGFDESGIDQPLSRQHTKNSVPFLPPVAGIRMNTPEFGNLSSWLSPGNSYPAVAIPSILPDRGEQTYPVVSTAGAQRILGPPTAGINFSPDAYRGPVLSSSAVAFPPGTPFPYPGFPFGTTNFSLPSTSFSSGSTMYLDSSSAGGLCFPAVPPQLVGAASAVSSHYPRPYVISLPDGGTNGGGESSRRWVRQGLDLNAGPGGTEMDGRDERLSSASRQLSVASSQTLAEEQMRVYQVAGAALKRKEPEGGRDADRFSYKQPWQ